MIAVSSRVYRLRVGTGFSGPLAAPSAFEARPHPETESTVLARPVRPAPRSPSRPVPYLLLAAFFLPFLGSALPGWAEEEQAVVLLEARGVIDPAVARYVQRGLREAREAEAAAVVIEMDTPGGLDGSMRKIIQAILDSPVPVIVYVSPPGARAASAGAFITVAAHVAAMAPGTNIGAAHPVQIGGEERPEGGKERSVKEAKLENDAAAYIRSIAGERGRNVTWAEAMVRQSASSSAEEALALEGIDFIAEDLEELFKQLEGRPVRTVFGVTPLALEARPLKPVPMSLIENLLHQVAHPNVAYLLLLLGIYGLIYELATPGTVFPGVVGAILLVVGLVALETLEANWGGIALIGLSLLFFVADIHLPGYGALTVGGLIAFVLGSLLLFPSARIPHLRLAGTIIGAAAAVTAGFFLGIVGVAIRSLRRKVTSGAEGLVGSEGVAKTDLKPEGLVHVKGEDWQALAEGPIRKGTRVKVIKLEGLTVHVQPI